MYQPDGCLGGLPSDEYTAKDFVYCRGIYLCGSNFPLPGIFQYYPYIELAVNFHYSADASYRISDAVADESSSNFDKAAGRAGMNSDKTVVKAGFYCWSVAFGRPEM